MIVKMCTDIKKLSFIGVAIKNSNKYLMKLFYKYFGLEHEKS